MVLFYFNPAPEPYGWYYIPPMLYVTQQMKFPRKKASPPNISTYHTFCLGFYFKWNSYYFWTLLKFNIQYVIFVCLQ